MDFWRREAGKLRFERISNKVIYNIKKLGLTRQGEIQDISENFLRHDSNSNKEGNLAYPLQQSNHDVKKSQKKIKELTGDTISRHLPRIIH